MLKRFYRFAKVAGVSIHIAPDGSFSMDGCLLELKGEDLTIVKKFDGISDLNTLKKQLPEGSLVALDISGKGILTRSVSNIVNGDTADLAKVLPNINAEEFAIQQAEAGESTFFAVIRKAEAEKWYNQFKEIGSPPLSLSLGPFPVMNIERELNVHGHEFVFHGHAISRNDQGVWTDVRYVPLAKAAHKIKLQQETLPEEILIPYAAAFQLIFDAQLQRISAPHGVFDELHRVHKEKQRLKIQGAAVLFVVFVSLLINFGIFSWLSSANTQLGEQLSRVQQSSTDVLSNAEAVKQKEAVLKTLGWDGGISKARLIDQLAALLPSDVRWTAVMINPEISVRGQGADHLGFASNTIKIEGTADKVLSVNEWMARIKTKTWVKGTQLSNYNFDHTENTGVFTLMITY